MMMLLLVFPPVMQWKEILVEHKMMMEVCTIHPHICLFTYEKIVKVKNPPHQKQKIDFILVEDVLCDINQEDIPENLITRFDYDK